MRRMTLNLYSGFLALLAFELHSQPLSPSRVMRRMLRGVKMASFHHQRGIRCTVVVPRRRSSDPGIIICKVVVVCRKCGVPIMIPESLDPHLAPPCSICVLIVSWRVFH